MFAGYDRLCRSWSGSMFAGSDRSSEADAHLGAEFAES